MQSFTLHMHTIGFDGKNSVHQMVKRAQTMGFSTVGISNHFIVHSEVKKSRFYEPSVKFGYNTIYSESFNDVISRFKVHYEEIDKLREQLGIQILRGMEVDFFDNKKWLDNFLNAINVLKPDYIIGSGHFVYYDGYLCNVHDIEKADNSVRDKMLELYWTKIRLAAESGLFTWLAHLDLPKKLGLGKEDKWFDLEKRTVKAIADSNTGIEINTGLYKPKIYEPYPSERILKLVSKYNIPVLISDDAHEVGQIGRHFSEAEIFAKKCGICKFMKIQKILDFSKKTV